MPTTEPLRLAAFDLDGTLLDSVGSIVESVGACWEACGFPMAEPDAIRRIIGLPWEESVRALLPSAGPEEFAKIHAYYDDLRKGLRPRPAREEALFEGALETLAHLSEAGFALAIVTSRTGDRLAELLDSHDIGGYFATYKTSDMGPGKPKPDLLLAAMRDVGAAPERTVMVGDTTYDIEMAVAARTAALGVSWGVHEVAELHAAGAHDVVELFAEVSETVVSMADRG